MGMRIGSVGIGSFLPGEGWGRGWGRGCSSQDGEKDGMEFSYGDGAILLRMGRRTRMEMRAEMATLGTRMGKRDGFVGTGPSFVDEGRDGDKHQLCGSTDGDRDCSCGNRLVLPIIGMGTGMERGRGSGPTGTALSFADGDGDGCDGDRNGYWDGESPAGDRGGDRDGVRDGDTDGVRTVLPRMGPGIAPLGTGKGTVLTGTGIAPMGTRTGPGSSLRYGDTDGRRDGGSGAGMGTARWRPGSRPPRTHRRPGRAGSGAGTGTGAGAGGQEAGRRHGAALSRERAGGTGSERGAAPAHCGTESSGAGPREGGGAGLTVRSCQGAWSYEGAWSRERGVATSGAWSRRRTWSPMAQRQPVICIRSEPAPLLPSPLSHSPPPSRLAPLLPLFPHSTPQHHPLSFMPRGIPLVRPISSLPHSPGR